ncbi:conserved hypothetical protein [Mesorhizobium delmotii]|uniref:Uncharacterized protein n=1 Tax=Mesorhizobium delmotii TaxID=1631247 RepID=A0A2P9AH11_9HYPH|nr:conserved hypothetical protein [Mesorhizobium delmotii]
MGEMSGRTEGGAVPPTCQPFVATPADWFLVENEGEQRLAILRAPLCPAGHLPHEGGDWQRRRRRSFL